MYMYSKFHEILKHKKIASHSVEIHDSIVLETLPLLEWNYEWSDTFIKAGDSIFLFTEEN